MNTNPLFKERGIGEGITDTIAYFQNEKPLVNKMLTVVLPIYAIIGVIAGYATKDISGIYIEMIKEIASGNFDPESFKEMAQKLALQNTGGMAGMSSLIGIISMVMHGMITSFAYNYVKERELQGHVSEDGLNNYLTKDIAWYIGYSFLLGIVMVLGMLGFGLVIALFSFLGKAIGVVFALLGMVAMIYFLFIYAVMFFPVCFLEDRKFGDALSRGAALMKGHFWETFVFLFVMGLIVGIVSLVLSGIMGFIGGLLGDTMAAIFAQTTQYAIAGMSGIVMIVAYSLWYGSLRNQYEGITSLGGYDTMIDEIGKKDF